MFTCRTMSKTFNNGTICVTFVHIFRIVSCVDIWCVQVKRCVASCSCGIKETAWCEASTLCMIEGIVWRCALVSDVSDMLIEGAVACISLYISSCVSVFSSILFALSMMLEINVPPWLSVLSVRSHHLCVWNFGCHKYIVDNLLYVSVQCCVMRWYCVSWWFV